MNAVLVLDKPAAFTSHDVVNRVRRLTGERSVGHLGTLDPMATGVLPLLLGRFTRLAQFFNDSCKTYEGEIRFGFATDTYDAEGEPVGPVSDRYPTLGEIHIHLPALTGQILQLPPVYSAKKINGVAAYKLARKDKPVEMRPVQVQVHRFEIQSVWGDRARFVAEVSAGTYIRSLAHDLGQALGCGAHLSSLRRTQAGEFNIARAVTLDQLTDYYAQLTKPSPIANLSEYAECHANLTIGGNLSATNPYLHPRLVLPAMPSVTATREALSAICVGRAVNLPDFSSALRIKVFADQQTLVAVCSRVAGCLFRPRVVLYPDVRTLP